MSQIITYEKCSHCGKEFNEIYISFGHPEKDFEWRWKCDGCGEINTRTIEAIPYF